MRIVGLIDWTTGNESSGCLTGRRWPINVETSVVANATAMAMGITSAQTNNKNGIIDKVNVST